VAPAFASSSLQYENKFYCLAAAAALIKYIEYTEKFTFARHSIKVDFQVATCKFLCSGAFLYAPYSFLLISNKFWMGGGGEQCGYVT
jgi:hypothetical protein